MDSRGDCGEIRGEEVGAPARKRSALLPSALVPDGEGMGERAPLAPSAMGAGAVGSTAGGFEGGRAGAIRSSADGVSGCGRRTNAFAAASRSFCMQRAVEDSSEDDAAAVASVAMTATGAAEAEGVVMAVEVVVTSAVAVAGAGKAPESMESWRKGSWGRAPMASASRMTASRSARRKPLLSALTLSLFTLLTLIDGAGVVAAGEVLLLLLAGCVVTLVHAAGPVVGLVSVVDEPGDRATAPGCCTGHSDAETSSVAATTDIDTCERRRGSKAVPSLPATDVATEGAVGDTSAGEVELGDGEEGASAAVLSSTGVPAPAGVVGAAAGEGGLAGSSEESWAGITGGTTESATEWDAEATRASAGGSRCGNGIGGGVAAVVACAGGDVAATTTVAVVAAAAAAA